MKFKNYQPYSDSLLLAFCLMTIIACDIEGEVREGSINSSISANSGSAGGNTPVLGGIYYDSLEGLTISDSGAEGEILVLNSNLEPDWVSVGSMALPSSGGLMTGNIQMNGNFLSGDSDDEGLFVDSQGFVGIGTNLPLHELHVVGNAGKTQGGTTWIMLSDERLKKDIKPLSKGLAEINKLNLKEFSYINNEFLGLKERKESGLIAQQVEHIFPEALVYMGQYMMLDYHPIYMAQLKSIQELSAKNKKMEQRIADLESKINRILK